MHDGWRANNPNQAPPPASQFFELAENAVHSSFKRENEQAAATVERQVSGVTSRPTHRKPKPLSLDEQAEKELEEKGVYDFQTRDPAEDEEGEY
jgi:hypothetical protein